MVSSVLQREFKNSDKGHCLSAASCLLSEFWGLLRVDRAATPLLWGRGGFSEQLALILRLEGKPQACRLSPLQLQATGGGRVREWENWEQTGGIHVLGAD